MTEDQIVQPISEATAKAFVNKHFPHLADQPIVYKGGGSFSAFIVSDSHVLRFSKGELSDEALVELRVNFQREKDLLESIRSTVAPHKVPTHLDFVIDKEIHKGGVWISEQFSGQTLESVINDGNMVEIAKLLGDFLSKLHSIDVNSLSNPNKPTLTKDELIQGWFDNYENNKQKIFALLTPEERLYMQRVYLDFLNIAEDTQPIVCLTHGDFDASNCMMIPGEKYLQIIDCEDIGLWEAAADFCTWYGHYGEAFLDNMLQNYSLPVDKYFKERVRFFWLRIPLNYFNYAIIQNNPKFEDFGRQMLTENMRKFKHAK